jgi:hypothetical protein
MTEIITGKMLLAEKYVWTKKVNICGTMIFAHGLY